MQKRFTRARGGIISVLASLSLLSACSGGGAIPSSQSPSAATSANVQRDATGRFLKAAVTGAADSSDIVYNVSPHAVLARTGDSPAAFPPPSACVAAFGLACYTPALIRKGYNVPAGLDGAGQTIVIVDAYGNPTVAHDLHVFDSAMGLPDPTLNIIYPDGQPSALPASHHAQSWEFETNLDVQWAHAIAPRATIDLVVAATNSGNVLNVAQDYAVTHHLGNVMSLSFGSPEAAIRGLGNNTQLKQADAIYQKAAANHMTVFASSGDSGAGNGLPYPNALFPASDPLVTAVGGTNLFLADDGTYEREDVWNDSDPSLCPFGCRDGVFGATGGAPSTIFAAPPYQSALSGMGARTTSDVGYNASVYTSILVYVGFPGISSGFYFFGGTSEGAPQWAGITALADQAAGHGLGTINPRLYAIGANAGQYGLDFHDITVGQNAFGSPGFPAKVGYDLPTGLGTPIVSHLVTDLTLP